MKRNNELFNENAVLALHPDYKTEIARIVRRIWLPGQSRNNCRITTKMILPLPWIY